MIVREAVLNHPEVAQLLKNEFVCIGIDNRANPNMTESEKEFLATRGGRSATVGMAIFTAGGEVLERGSSYTPEPTLKKLRSALAKFQPEDPAKVQIPELTEEERQSLRTPPEEGLVLNVTWKLLETERQEGSATTGGARYADCFANSLGVDRLWARSDEADELARGTFPESLQRRIRSHLNSVLAGKTQEMNVTCKDGRLSGTVVSDTGERAELLGFIETENGRLTRFDLLVKGVAVRVSNAGFSAGLSVIPTNETAPVAILLTLADRNHGGDLWRVVPHRSRNRNYLE